MAQRDDLEAAHARIAALKAALARLQSSQDDKALSRALAERDQHARRVQALERELEAARHSVTEEVQPHREEMLPESEFDEKTEARLHRSAPPSIGSGIASDPASIGSGLPSDPASIGQGIASDPASIGLGLPSLVEHNRGRPPVAGQTAARVLCPRCLEAGEEVEMVLGKNRLPLGRTDREYVQEVWCPSCALLDHMRRTR